jgi:hypothetical protein
MIRRRGGGKKTIPTGGSVENRRHFREPLQRGRQVKKVLKSPDFSGDFLFSEIYFGAKSFIASVALRR